AGRKKLRADLQSGRYAISDGIAYALIDRVAGTARDLSKQPMPAADTLYGLLCLSSTRTAAPTSHGLPYAYCGEPRTSEFESRSRRFRRRSWEAFAPPPRACGWSRCWPAAENRLFALRNGAGSRGPGF